MRLTYRIGILFLLGIAAACSGAQEQDVLSNQIGNATTSGGSGTSGNTTSGGNTSSGSSGQTSSSGAASSGGGTTSGDVPPGCVGEKEDSTEKNPLKITSCAAGAFHFPVDQEDWLEFERPNNSSFSAKWTGPLSVTFWDERGRSYDLQHLPNKAGTYSIQIQYDFKNYPLSGDQLGTKPVFDWTFEIGF